MYLDNKPYNRKEKIDKSINDEKHSEDHEEKVLKEESNKNKEIQKGNLRLSKKLS